MGKRDVVNYYLSVQSQYLEMLEDIKDFDEALKNGQVNQQQYDQALESLSKLKENYERLSYIILLLQEPNRQTKKAKFKKRNELVYDYLDGSSQDIIKSENDDILKELKRLIGEINNG